VTLARPLFCFTVDYLAAVGLNPVRAIRDLASFQDVRRMNAHGS
jgi:hypothetical protein